MENNGNESRRHLSREASKEEKLIAENDRLKGVIAEIATENLQLKKVLGNNRVSY